MPIDGKGHSIVGKFQQHCENIYILFSMMSARINKDRDDLDIIRHIFRAQRESVQQTGHL